MAFGHAAVLLIFACIYCVRSNGPLCLDCPHVADPSHCTTPRVCHWDEECATELHVNHGNYEWKFHCKKINDCPHRAALPMNHYGFRRGGHEHEKVELCNECCTSNSIQMCNRYLCANYNPIKYTPPPTTTVTVPPPMSTTKPQTVYDPNCRDHEEDGVTCSMLDEGILCTAVDRLDHLLAQKKCQKYCGFCTPVSTTIKPLTLGSTTLPIFTATSACRDIDDYIDCATMDKQNICTSTAATLVYLRNHNCRKHCGLCH